MKFILNAVQHRQSEIRNAGIDCIVQIYKQIGDEVMKYIKDLKTPLQIVSYINISLIERQFNQQLRKLHKM